MMTMTKCVRALLGLFVAAAMLASAPRQAEAGLIAGYETQLSGWLGQGPLDFTLLYAKESGHTSLDFHAGVDGKGATFTLIEAFFEGETYIIGGYNPQSWHSGGGYNITPAIEDRTAFIYNLTTSVVQTQRTDASSGPYQTYNWSFYGPTFGSGVDIYVAGNLINGQTFQGSYGTAGPCGSGGVGGENILGTSYYNAPCSDTGEPYQFTIGALEVYTFAPAATSVPDGGAAMMLLAVGLVALATTRRYFPA